MIEIEKERLEAEKKAQKLLIERNDILSYIVVAINEGEILVDDLPYEARSALYMRRIWDAYDLGTEDEEIELIADELDCSIHEIYEFTHGYGDLPG